MPRRTSVKANFALVHRDHDVAGAEQSERAAVAIAVDPRQRRLAGANPRPPSNVASCRASARFSASLACACACISREVRAGAEHISGARELHHAHRRDRARTVASAALKRGDRRAVEGIAFVRTIERDVRNAAGKTRS